MFAPGISPLYFSLFGLFREQDCLWFSPNHTFQLDEFASEDVFFRIRLRLLNLLNFSRWLFIVFLNNMFCFVGALNQVLFSWLVQWRGISSVSIWGGQGVREPRFWWLCNVIPFLSGENLYLLILFYVKWFPCAFVMLQIFVTVNYICLCALIA